MANGGIQLTGAGNMIEKWWLKMPDKFPSIELDLYTVMPNHFHGIISFVGADPCVCPDTMTSGTAGAHMGAPLQKIIQWFKTMTMSLMRSEFI